jgi:Domain of unknown function (DUF4395)
MAGSATLVDPRGLRFAATITAIVLAVVLLTSNGIVLAVQAAVFAIGAFGYCLGCEMYLLSRRLLTTRKGVPA